jgi:hypothetical protein
MFHAACSIFCIIPGRALGPQFGGGVCRETVIEIRIIKSFPGNKEKTPNSAVLAVVDGEPMITVAASTPAGTSK